MKTTNLSDGYVRLTPAKNKKLFHRPSGRYYSEAEVKAEKAGDFVETSNK